MPLDASVYPGFFGEEGATLLAIRRSPAHWTRMELTKDSVALVTGANGGIGAAIARALHKEGAKIILSGRRPDALEALAKELDARVIVADLSKRDDVRRLNKEAGELDVLVLNAALPASGDIMEFSEEQIDRALDVNLRAPIVSARELAESMVRRQRGQIIFISSISGKVATQGQSMYNATKFGLRGFAFAMREDLRDKGVGVTSIFPGFIRDAGMFAETGVKLPAGAGTRSPEDCARAVLKAVRTNPAEIDVAAFEQSLGGVLFPVAPSFITWFQKMAGGHKIAAQMADAQKHKR